MNKSQKWLPAATLAAILCFTLIGIGLSRGGDIYVNVEKGTGAFIIAVLVAVGIFNVATVRFHLLPRAIANPKAAPEAVVMVGYSFAVAPSIYGIVASIITGEGLLALPFGAIAIGGLVVVWSYLRESPARMD